MPTLVAGPTFATGNRRPSKPGSRPPVEPHDLARLLPAKGDPEYLWVLCEMVRTDIELTWSEGRPRRLNDYRTDFPELFHNTPVLSVMATEEYRIREAHGDHPDPGEYVREFGVTLFDRRPVDHLTDTIAEQVALVRALPPEEDHVTDRIRPWAGGMAGPGSFPSVGETFLGFRLTEELGRGAFARVYLARQVALADRAVALKVTTRPTQEPERLAKLQHTNIVPIFSVHSAGSLQAVCMPYIGRATLADTLNALRKNGTCPQSGSELFSTIEDAATVPNALPDAPTPPTGMPGLAPEPEASPQPVRDMLARMSYLDAVAWVIARLSEGLAHAHRRGIRHYDLKPANVLLGDDGQPMLLDFNLAHDVSAGKREQLGGTVMYMAPEQLEEVRNHAPGRVSERTDLYSLGVIFYELLTGRHPFALTGQSNKVAAALELRKAGAPSVRKYNPAVSPAIEAIVHKLLEPEPARRYLSAEQLWTDLDRHASHLPLLHTPEPSPRESFRKWRHRNPGVFRRIGAMTAALAVTLAGSWAFTAHQAYRHSVAEDTLRQFRADLVTLRVDLTGPLESPARPNGIAKAKDWLAAFGVSDAGVSGWNKHPVLTRLRTVDRQALAADLGETAALLALSERPGDRPEAERAAARARARTWFDAAIACFEGQPVPGAIRDGRAAGGEPVPPDTGPADEDSPRAAFLRGVLQYTDGRVIDATEQFERVTHARADHFAGQYLLGMCLIDQFQPIRAQERFDMAKALAPNDYRPAFNRSLALLQSGRLAEAEQELTGAIALAPSLPNIYFQRAIVRARWKPAEALADLTRAADLGGSTIAILSVRACTHDELGRRATTAEVRDREQALAAADRETLLASEPKSAREFAIRGYNLLLRKESKAALAAFQSATARDAKDFVSWYNQASVLAEGLELPDDAVRALDKSVEANPQFPTAVINRALIHARLGHREQAILDAERGLKMGPLPPSLVYKAACVYAQTSRKEPRDADHAITLLRQAAKQGFHTLKDHYSQDKDLALLRDRADFQELVRSLQTIVQ